MIHLTGAPALVAFFVLGALATFGVFALILAVHEAFERWQMRRFRRWIEDQSRDFEVRR
jgi:hypothetical protein